MRNKSHSIDVLFGFALFGLFTVLSLMLVLIGANVYNGVVRASDNSNEVRASLSYVTNKVRAEDHLDGVLVENRDGVEALVVRQQINEKQYETLIYFYDGSLREMFRRSDQKFDPARGQELAELAGFSASKDERGLLTLTIETTQGAAYTSQVALRT